MALRALAGRHPLAAIRRLQQQPFRLQFSQGRLRARPLQPIVAHAEGQFSRCAFQMTFQDDLIVRVHHGPLGLPLEKGFGLMDEILIQRILARHEQYGGFLPRPPHAAPALQGGNDRPRIAHQNAHVEAADVDPQFQRAGRHHGKQLAVAHARLDLAPLLGQKARPVRADASSPTSGLVRRPQRDEFGHAPGTAIDDGPQAPRQRRLEQGYGHRGRAVLGIDEDHMPFPGGRARFSDNRDVGGSRNAFP